MGDLPGRESPRRIDQDLLLVTTPASDQLLSPVAHLPGDGLTEQLRSTAPSPEAQALEDAQVSAPAASAESQVGDDPSPLVPEGDVCAATCVEPDVESDGVSEGVTAEEAIDPEAQARHEFKSLLSVPGLGEVLKTAVATGGDFDTGLAWDVNPETSLPQIAAQCSGALRRLAPQILTADCTSDKHRLLASFTERYDTLFNEHTALQQRCRELTQKLSSNQSVAQQVEAWKAAHQESNRRADEFATENRTLRTRIRTLEDSGFNPEEKRVLVQKLAHREADVRAANDALRQLQEVVEENAGTNDARCASLRQDVSAARAALVETRAEIARQVSVAQEAQEAMAAAQARESEALARCASAEREAQEMSSALEALLQQKARFLEEREHAVDRRVVGSMVANYVDLLASGHDGLAKESLGLMLQVVGGTAEMADRKRIRASAGVHEEAPLALAFAEWLEEETSGTS